MHVADNPYTAAGGAVQLGANYQNPLGWFAGAWGSNVDPYPGGASSKELDVYAGVNRSLGADFTLRGIYTHYAYLQDPRPARYDHNEFAATIAYLDLIAATVSYQPDSSSYSAGFCPKASDSRLRTHRPLAAPRWICGDGWRRLLRSARSVPGRLLGRRRRTRIRLPAPDA